MVWNLGIGIDIGQWVLVSIWQYQASILETSSISIISAPMLEDILGLILYRVPQIPIVNLSCVPMELVRFGWTKLVYFICALCRMIDLMIAKIGGSPSPNLLSFILGESSSSLDKMRENNLKSFANMQFRLIRTPISSCWVIIESAKRMSKLAVTGRTNLEWSCNEKEYEGRWLLVWYRPWL